MKKLALIAAVLLNSCAGHPGAGKVRFVNRPPVTAVNDRQDVAEKPEEEKFTKILYHFDGFYHRRLTRWMGMHGDRRAANVNSMGEVPDSSWFHNRIGVREMTPEEIARGPNLSGSAEERKPWTIVSSKVGGVSPGFIIEDVDGGKFLLKFDLRGIPEMETGADVIVQRLLWACGYNVPEDEIVHFTVDDLVVAPDAIKKDVFGDESPLSREDVLHELKGVNSEPDGTIRGLVSRFVSGIPLGGWAREGVREDDPNDLVPHELRRDLRGSRAFFAWLDHTDIKEDNTLDMWQEDPAYPGHHYVVHYLIDFGKALGVQGAVGEDKFVGYNHLIDFSQVALSLITLGIDRRPWEHRPVPEIQGVGLYDSETYDPGLWKAFTPSYFPILLADRFDQFWASKILIRFTPEQIRAAVEQARFSDPRATEYLVRTLIARQRKTARHWFERVNPVDEFEIERTGDSQRLCFTDLAVANNLERSLVADSSYALTIYDASGRALSRQVVPGTLDGRICLLDFVPAPEDDAYTIVRIETRRRFLDVPPALLHLARDPDSGVMRVIGLWRQ